MTAGSGSVCQRKEESIFVSYSILELNGTQRSVIVFDTSLPTTSTCCAREQCLLSYFVV